MKFIKILLLVVCNFCLFLFLGHASQANTGQPPYISIGTGYINGIYYPAGAKICKILNDNQKFGIKCFTESTSGSVYNLSASRSKKIDIGFSQNDWLYYSYNGKDIFEKIGEDKNLRTLITTHTESVIILARGDSGIKSINDLKNRAISIGLADSGTRWTIQRIFDSIGISKKELSRAKELKPSDEMREFCAGTIDAMFVVYGNPNVIVQEMIKGCNAKIISIEKEYAAKIIQNHPFYVESVIPSSLYKTPTDISTIGMKSSIFVSKNLSDDLVYKMTKLIVENLSDIAKTNEVLSHVKKGSITKNAVVPFHDGALKYYTAAGLIEKQKIN